MGGNTGLEALEGRSHFAASSPALDPKYIFGAQEVTARMRSGFTFFQAVPAAGGRTYLLADKRADADQTPTPVLSIIAVGPDGKPDPTFGDGGIAVTGFISQPHYATDSPGILKVADTGFLYFADDSRVMRFRPNGRVDRTFGDRGSITYSDSSQPVALADIAPVIDGVMIATTKAYRGVEYFDVVKVDRKRHVTVWSAKHNTGVRSYAFDGTYGGSESEPDANNQQLRTGQMQFAQGEGGLTLVRTESDRAWYAPFAELPAETRIGVTRQNVVVTRFTRSGEGTDFTRREMRRADEHASAIFGDKKDVAYGLYQSSAALIQSGRTLVVQTDQELLRFILNFGDGYTRRTPLPGINTREFKSPTYRLLRDGGLYVIDGLSKPTNPFYFNITRYQIDGQRDFTFADGGLLSVQNRDFTGGDNELIRQLFLDATGRFNFLAGNGAGTDANGKYYPPTLTVRRV
jgi:hypothetical protein